MNSERVKLLVKQGGRKGRRCEGLERRCRKVLDEEFLKINGRFQNLQGCFWRYWILCYFEGWKIFEKRVVDVGGSNKQMGRRVGVEENGGLVVEGIDLV